MLYELILTPQVFEKINLEEIPNQWYRETLEILKASSKNGIIISLNKDEWIRESLIRLNYLSPHLKDKILSLFKRLKDANLIVKIPKSTINASSESEWIAVANDSQNGIPFGMIVATQHMNEHIYTPIEMIDSEIWEEKNQPTLYIEQSEANMEKHLATFLRYAQKIQIIDPYFNIQKGRYKKSLEIISRLFSSRRGFKMGRSIVIHCKYDEFITNDANYTALWKQMKEDIFKTYGHTCMIYIWKESDKKMHDRFIITDQFGLSIGAGLDIREQNKTSWSLIDNNTKSEVLKDYQENSSPFELAKVI